MKRNGNSYKNLLLETKLINPKREETVYPFLEICYLIYFLLDLIIKSIVPVKNDTFSLFLIIIYIYIYF